VSASKVRGGALEAKVLPPAARRFVIARDRLDERLAQARLSRLTTVVAGAGFGKSTLLAEWAIRERCAWYTVTAEDRDLGAFVQGVVDALRLRLPGLVRPLALAVEGVRGPDAEADEVARAQAYAALVCGTVQEHLRTDLVLVLDDVDELGDAQAPIRFLEGMCRQAPVSLHLVLASRREPPFSIARLRGRGEVVEIAGSALAFDEAEVAAVLTGLLGPAAAALAPALREATGGWPAAVRLAGEALQTVPPQGWDRAVRRVPHPGGPISSYLAEEVFAGERPEVASLVRTVAPLESFTAELATALGVPDAPELVAALDRRGLFLEPRGEDGWYSLAPLIREFATAHLGPDPLERGQLCGAAARWLEEHGRHDAALRQFMAAENPEGAVRVLVANGPALLASGVSELVIQVAAWLPDELADEAVHRVAGEAHQVRGEWDAALERYGRLAEAGEVDAAVAWRMGLIHHLRGDLDLALQVYERGRLGTGEARDDALLLAWTAAAYWLRGDVETCRDRAERASEIATGCGDHQALAAAHTALAMLAALESDRRANDAHYLRALDHAERAGDVLQVIRIRANRGSRLCEEGYYREALDELDVAIRLAEVAGFASFQSLALSNRGEALLRLGRLDEAISDLEAARDIQQRLGSRLVSYPLGTLGDVFRERGDLALARSAYEEAVEVSSGSGDLQGLVPALAGLARVLVGEEPAEAAGVAEEALAHGPVLGRQRALLAAGWVALARGNAQSAAERAAEAGAVSRGRRDRAGVAESLELLARSSPDRGSQRDRWEQARAIWHELGSSLGEARVDLALARLTGPEEAVALAERAERTFRELGVRIEAAEARGVGGPAPSVDGAPVVVRSLGGFRVLRGGEPVSLSEWQSRKARTLLKVLVARRGRPVHREELLELLWPDEDPGRTSSRLSVALSTLRGVLDPDKRLDAEHFVSADRLTVRLQLEHLRVDVEEFLAQADAGLRAQRDGHRADAAALLAGAEAAYAGDFLPEDPFDDWAVPLREEARNLYVGVARALAEEATGRDEHDAATRYLLRILERDAYDERAHLGLVSALAGSGRHGEARRAYRAYAARMGELGIEALPFTEAAGR
jgi:ATP/maltotriose-dependent transcriptional regulator MalT/DNA-binding SARP family transcriptional activator